MQSLSRFALTILFSIALGACQGSSGNTDTPAAPAQSDNGAPRTVYGESVAKAKDVAAASAESDNQVSDQSDEMEDDGEVDDSAADADEVDGGGSGEEGEDGASE